MLFNNLVYSKPFRTKCQRSGKGIYSPEISVPWDLFDGWSTWITLCLSQSCSL